MTFSFVNIRICYNGGKRHLRDEREMCMGFIKLLIKIPLWICQMILRMIKWILKMIFGLLFGWIPDLDERMSGEDFEEYVKEVLKRNGYQHVQMTKRSGDYGVDILAYFHHESYAFQCKFYHRPVGVSAIQQAYAGCMYYGCDKAVVVTNATFTAQAKSLATHNEVLLWDGEKLEKMKKHANRHALFRSHQRLDYGDILALFVGEGFASEDLLEDYFHLSKKQIRRIFKTLEKYDLVSQEDDLGIRDIYFQDVEVALEKIKKI